MALVRPLRGILFDAGNTLIRINYDAIAGQLAVLGCPVTSEAVQRAEWRARVRLDDEVLAHPGVLNQSGRATNGYRRRAP